MVGGGCWLTAMQNCWMFASWPCIAGSGNGGCLFLHRCLCGGACGAEICKRFTVQCDRGVIVHDGHAISMVRGWDRCLVDECDCGGPIFFEGVDRLNDRQGFVLTCDPIFVLLGVHPTSFDDVQADVNDVVIIHRVACPSSQGAWSHWRDVSRRPFAADYLCDLWLLFCHTSR